MKHFETPEMEVRKYEISDVIAVSGGDSGGDGNVGGEIFD